MKALYLFLLLVVSPAFATEPSMRTHISLQDGRWRVNDRITNPGSAAEGLLMNVRMVNATFEDRHKADFDAEANTDRFIVKIDDYAGHGVNAFTLCLQGGMPGYEGALNSAFEPDGSLRGDVTKRIERVIRACDQRGMAVILGLFYQRQSTILKDDEAVRAGVVNTVKWVRDRGFQNVLIEIANEYPHKGFAHDLIRRPEGIASLIRLAKEAAPGLLVSASGYGDGLVDKEVAEAADFLLPHWNGVSVEQIPARIAAMKKFGRPIVCNEDNKTGEKAVAAMQATITNGAGYGLMLEKHNQAFPFHFDGAEDEKAYYTALKATTAPANGSAPSSKSAVNDSWPEFRHHFASLDLPTDGAGRGDYGLTALVDLNRDGHLDFVVGGRLPKPERLYWFEYRGPDEWVRHEIGRDYQSDVGLAVLDVDGDGWPDLVCSGVWFRNPGPPGDQPWERFVFAKDAGGAHDIVAADIDGDGRKDIVMMSDEHKPLKALCWFKIPADPRQLWERHDIGPGIHGGIAPAGVADINGDGHADVVRGDTWFENKDGKGTEWVAHPNIPMGRKGPFGVCVRTIITDIDGNGKKAIVMCDADIPDSKMVILRNPDGKGETWTKQELPQSFRYGSLHSLAVADLNGDGRLDIISNEQEELLLEGRKNPRWIAWENLGGGNFKERILLDMKLGGHELQVGDVDGDGDIDIVSKPWGAQPWNGAGGKLHVDFLENLLHALDQPSRHAPAAQRK